MKRRKEGAFKKKVTIKSEIEHIYHEYNGVCGYRTIRVYLNRRGISISRLTVHKYMNQEWKFYSITRRRKTVYEKGKTHKVFENKVKQNFTAEQKNQIWCTDFTYLFLTNGSKRYNGSIIDVYDRSIIASITDKHITSERAKHTLQKALDSHSGVNTKTLILHSDQGSQYTSKEFTEYCEQIGIIQSMNKAGCPYDNAPMERYFNTLKNELIYHAYYHNDKKLYLAIEEFAYVKYNHMRHTLIIIIKRLSRRAMGNNLL